MYNNVTAIAQPDYKKILTKSIYETYFYLCKEFELKDGEDVSYDFYVVKRIIDRCMLDFERLSEHHGIKNANSHKIAGYLIYWMCKLTPLKILNYEIYNCSYNHYLNQIFAINTGMTIVNHEKKLRASKEPELNNEVVRFEYFGDIIRDLLYTLRYCDLNPDLLSMIYCYADITAGQVIPKHKSVI